MQVLDALGRGLAPVSVDTVVCFPRLYPPWAWGASGQSSPSSQCE